MRRLSEGTWPGTGVGVFGAEGREVDEGTGIWLSEGSVQFEGAEG